MTDAISGTAADIIGVSGSIIFIAAFAYANVVTAMNKLWFNVANLAGAVRLLTSLSVHFNLAAFILELAWAGIAIAGIVGALHARGNRV
jgi:hypothetical protein